VLGCCTEADAIPALHDPVRIEDSLKVQLPMGHATNWRQLLRR
jgi:hypothetical protein